MILKKMVIQNFKGIKSLEIDFSEKSNIILGLNGTGKTSVYDAYCWCLFEKDSQNKSRFDIRNYNIDENAETLVEVVFDNVKLKRTFGKKQRKRTHNGVSETILENDYDRFINDINTPATKFNKAVEEIIGDSETFKILSNIFYFPAIMSADNRRKFLFDIFGNFSDSDILAEKEFAELLKKMGSMTIEEAKKQISFESKKNSEQLKAIPTRITEVENMKNDVNAKEKESAEAELEKLQEIKKTYEKEKDSINSGDKSVLNNKLEALKNEKISIINDASKMFNLVTKKQNEEITGLNKKIAENQYKTSDIENQIRVIKNDNLKKEDEKKEDEKLIKKLNAEREELREKWITLNNKQFDESETVCYACKQELPESKKEEIKKTFEENKKKELKEIQEKGKKLKSEVEELEKKEYIFTDYGDLIDKLQKLISENEDYKKKIAEIEKEIEEKKHEPNTDDVDKMIQEVKKQIDDSEADSEAEIKKIDEKIAEIEPELKKYQAIINDFNANEKAEKRLKEIQEEKEKLNEVEQELAYRKHLIDLFEKRKAELNENNINKHFKNVQFRLFELQINGGLKEVCEATIDESPFNSNLNTGSKILAGLEIVEVLSKKLGVKFPVFIDNRESLTSEIETDLQVISLVASENDKSFKADKKIKL